MASIMIAKKLMKAVQGSHGDSKPSSGSVQVDSTQQQPHRYNQGAAPYGHSRPSGRHSSSDSSDSDSSQKNFRYLGRQQALPAKFCDQCGRQYGQSTHSSQDTYRVGNGSTGAPEGQICRKCGHGCGSLGSPGQTTQPVYGQGFSQPPGIAQTDSFQPMNRYPQNNGMYPQSSDQYPQSSNQYPQSGGQYPQSGGQYPQSGGQYPQSGGQYPQSGGQYPHSGGQYPQSGGQSGSQYNQYNPPNGPFNQGSNQFTQYGSSSGQYAGGNPGSWPGSERVTPHRDDYGRDQYYPSSSEAHGYQSGSQGVGAPETKEARKARKKEIEERAKEREERKKVREERDKRREEEEKRRDEEEKKALEGPGPIHTLINGGVKYLSSHRHKSDKQ